MQYAAVFASLVAFIAVLPFYMRWSMRREHARLHALPVSPIAGLAAGAKVRVVGKAEALDGDATHPVIWRGVPVLTGGPHPVGGAPAPLIAKPFRVTDETGSIEVSTEHLDVRAGGTLVQDELTQRIANRHQESVGYHDMLLVHRIEPGTQIAVIAMVRSRADGTRELAGSKRDPVIIAEP